MHSDQSNAGDGTHSNSHVGESSASQFQRYMLLSFVFIAALFLVSKEIPNGQLWSVILSVFVFAVPMILSGFYRVSIGQIDRLNRFQNRGWIFQLLSGRWLRLLYQVVVGIACSFFLTLQFQFYSAVDWIGFLLVVPVFWGVLSYVKRSLGGELKIWSLYERTMLYSSRGAPLVMLLIVLLSSIFYEPKEYSSLQDAIDAERISVTGTSGVSLVAEISYYLTTYNGAKAYVLGHSAGADVRAYLFFAFGEFFVFFSACTVLSCFAIPPIEYRRILGPLSEDPMPSRIPPSRIALTTAVTTFFALFIYVPLFAKAEAWIQANSETANSARQFEAAAIQRLDRIGESFYQEGTLARIQDVGLSLVRGNQERVRFLEQEADKAFEMLTGNVDLYLGWYYSLAGEYGRLGKLLSGDIEIYMQDKFKEYLHTGEVFASFDDALKIAINNNSAALAQYQESSQTILDENLVEVEESKKSNILVVNDSALDAVMTPPSELLEFESRLLASGGGGLAAGGLTGVIVAKVAAKVAGKSTFKFAATAFSKVVAAKAGGAAIGAGGGAAIGGLIGSIVPVIGTAIGAAVGGVMGAIGVGVAVDASLINLEEYFKRSEFRAQIVAGINEQRDAFKAQLRL